MANPEYIRLTRASSRSTFALAVISRTSLWLGPDHILFVDSTGFTETYKRFYFRDIQALIVQRSANFTIINIVVAIPFTFLMAGALVTSDAVPKGVLFVLAGILAIVGIINVLGGATCRCYLRTAVQEEHLASLSRLRRANKILDRIRPLIVAAQADSVSSESGTGQTTAPERVPSAAVPENSAEPNLPGTSP